MVAVNPAMVCARASVSAKPSAASVLCAPSTMRPRVPSDPKTEGLPVAMTAVEFASMIPPPRTEPLVQRMERASQSPARSC